LGTVALRRQFLFFLNNQIDSRPADSDRSASYPADGLNSLRSTARITRIPQLKLNGF
jgi:hypothetical protein